MASYDWAMFAARLDPVLTELVSREHDAVLILSDSREQRRFVQYVCGQPVDGIIAEVSGDKYLPRDSQLSTEAKQQLAADGWEKPGGRWWAPSRNPNWSSFHDAGGAGFRKVTDMSVRALRDVLRIESPSLLVYHAFVHATGEAITLDRLELAKAPDA